MENTNTSDLFAVRSAKLQAMRQAGFDPFSQNWEQKQTSLEAKALFDDTAEEEPGVSVAGRILVFRDMGKACFIKILDRAGEIQAYVKRDEIGESAYEAFKQYDIGDIIGFEGPLFKTKTGEITVRVKTMCLLSKALRPLPEKWHGLVDNEAIYRQRYLDLICNAESRKRMFLRSQIIREIRQFLWNRDFIEVETPMLQSVAGGAAARPFTTHMNALDCDFYLRISLELYLKRLLVAGVDRVFELGRNFRNEGLSRRHNPEFTMIELYQAYSDFRGMMRLIRDLIQHLCKTVIGATQIKNYEGVTIDLGGEWREVRYKDLIIEATQDPQWFSRTKAEKLQKCAELGIEVNPDIEDFEVTKNVYEKCVEPNLIQPTFVTHIQKELCPLAKINKADNSVIDVFELCINGQEIAPAYSEQNDPFIQRTMFEAQAGEDQQAVDQDFLKALEHGMPPAGGLGMGIDRLVILLTGASNIRDTILFPSLRPE
ncbi:MAG: lysine--tRNA ligase [Verrucomicrobia bacterium GWF2_51_19]|nr:MAG: lysine--tRNA ligase [Verrucomicrobia bacterium GWF2_51_19]HCJ12478.1 lysine--tRNA ligase [Opitutae bacterium]